MTEGCAATDDGRHRWCPDDDRVLEDGRTGADLHHAVARANDSAF